MLGSQRRPQGTTPLAALREHYRSFAAGAGLETADWAGPGVDLLARVRVITESPALRVGAIRLQAAQQAALADALDADADEDEDDRECAIWPSLAAAQICATISALKSTFFARLAAGDSFERAAARLPGDVELAPGRLGAPLGRRPVR